MPRQSDEVEGDNVYSHISLSFKNKENENLNQNPLKYLNLFCNFGFIEETKLNNTKAAIILKFLLEKKENQTKTNNLILSNKFNEWKETIDQFNKNNQLKIIYIKRKNQLFDKKIDLKAYDIIIISFECYFQESKAHSAIFSSEHDFSNVADDFINIFNENQYFWNKIIIDDPYEDFLKRLLYNDDSIDFFSKIFKKANFCWLIKQPITEKVKFDYYRGNGEMNISETSNYFYLFDVKAENQPNKEDITSYFDRINFKVSHGSSFRIITANYLILYRCYDKIQNKKGLGKNYDVEVYFENIETTLVQKFLFNVINNFWSIDCSSFYENVYSMHCISHLPIANRKLDKNINSTLLFSTELYILFYFQAILLIKNDKLQTNKEKQSDGLKKTKNRLSLSAEKKKIDILRKNWNSFAKNMKSLFSSTSYLRILASGMSYDYFYKLIKENLFNLVFYSIENILSIFEEKINFLPKDYEFTCNSDELNSIFTCCLLCNSKSLCIINQFVKNHFICFFCIHKIVNSFLNNEEDDLCYYFNLEKFLFSFNDPSLLLDKIKENYDRNNPILSSVFFTDDIINDLNKDKIHLSNTMKHISQKVVFDENIAMDQLVKQDIFCVYERNFGNHFVKNLEYILFSIHNKQKLIVLCTETIVINNYVDAIKVLTSNDSSFDFLYNKSKDSFHKTVQRFTSEGDLFVLFLNNIKMIETCCIVNFEKLLVLRESDFSAGIDVFPISSSVRSFNTEGYMIYLQSKSTKLPEFIQIDHFSYTKGTQLCNTPKSARK